MLVKIKPGLLVAAIFTASSVISLWALIGLIFAFQLWQPRAALVCLVAAALLVLAFSVRARDAKRVQLVRWAAAALAIPPILVGLTLVMAFAL